LVAAAAIFTADAVPVPLLVPLAVCIVGAALFWWRRSPIWFWVVVAAAFFSLHSLRHLEGGPRKFAKQLAGEQRAAVVTGVVEREPEIRDGARGLRVSDFVLRADELQLAGGGSVPAALLKVRWIGGTPAYGDRVRLTGVLRSIPGPRNPGEFDERGYLARQEIYLEMRVRYGADGAVLSSGHGNRLVQWAADARRWMQRELGRDLESEPEVASLLQSMVLGMKGETPAEVKELFQKTGTLHLFAVSGLNVAMLGAIAALLLRPLARWQLVPLMVLGPLLLFYAMITGAGASSVRAALMAGFGYLAVAVDRRTQLANVLGATAVAILLWDSNQLFRPGFQFSFALVIAIVTLTPRIEKPLARIGRPDPFLPRPLWGVTRTACHGVTQVLAQNIAVCVAAWIGSLLFMAGYFHLISPSALVANLLAVPLAFLLLALAVLALLCAPVASGLTALCNNASWLIAKVLIACVAHCAEIPGGHVYVDWRAPLGQAPEAKLTVFDAGSGGAIFLQTQRERWLLDCASAGGYQQFVRPCLRKRGVNRLDGILLSHGDAQHIGGAQGAIEDFGVGRVIDSPAQDRSRTRKQLAALLRSRGSALEIHQAGEVIDAGETRLRLLHPPENGSGRTADDKALVVRAEVGEVRILYVSDIGFAAEQWMVGHAEDLRSDILIKGWHSKDVSGTPDFLRAVNPRVIIVAAPDTFYVDPHRAEWIAEMRRIGIAVFDQAETGAVEIEARDGDFAVRSFLGDQDFRSSAR
jgi:competence protein ComEC